MATEYQADSTARAYLDDHGFDARLFLVQRRVRANAVRPAALMVEPAFPGYLIVRLAPTDPLHRLRRDSRHGIDQLLTAVGHPDRPAFLSDEAMLALLDLAEQNLWTGTNNLLGQIGEDGRLRPVPQPHEPLEDLTGEELEISGHPLLSGLRGECVRSGPERVTLLLRTLGMERRIVAQRDQVRRVRR